MNCVTVYIDGSGATLSTHVIVGIIGKIIISHAVLLY